MITLSIRADRFLGTAKENVVPQTGATDEVEKEKVAGADQEPPVIKEVQDAHGMSATSGPLEDFPEGF